MVSRRGATPNFLASFTSLLFVLRTYAASIFAHPPNPAVFSTLRSHPCSNVGGTACPSFSIHGSFKKIVKIRKIFPLGGLTESPKCAAALISDWFLRGNQSGPLTESITFHPSFPVKGGKTCFHLHRSNVFSWMMSGIWLPIPSLSPKIPAGISPGPKNFPSKTSFGSPSS